MARNAVFEKPRSGPALEGDWQTGKVLSLVKVEEEVKFSFIKVLTSFPLPVCQSPSTYRLDRVKNGRFCAVPRVESCQLPSHYRFRPSAKKVQFAQLFSPTPATTLQQGAAALPLGYGVRVHA